MREGERERVSAHRILGARGLGELEDGPGVGGTGGKQTTKGSGNKDQILGVGGWGWGQKGKPEEQLGNPGVRDEGTRGTRGKPGLSEGWGQEQVWGR